MFSLAYPACLRLLKENPQLCPPPSGKMQVLDKLLSKLKTRGHRVVLFSQFKMMLVSRPSQQTTEAVV